MDQPLVKLALLAVLTLALGCQRTLTSQVLNQKIGSAAIVGGRPVQVGSYFSNKVVLIKIMQVVVTQEGDVTYTKSSGARCTGTFIDRQTVLTAAHCLKGFEFNSITVSIETDDSHVFFVSPAKHFVANTLYHGGLNDIDNDIALIKSDVVLPDEFSPVELATKSPPPQTAVGAVGFGIDTYSDDRSTQLSVPPALRFVSLKTSSSNALNANSAKTISADAGPAAGMSFGDSGGPLFVYEEGVLKQLGVASNLVCHDVDKSVFADAYVLIPASMTWINQAKTELQNQK